MTPTLDDYVQAFLKQMRAPLKQSSTFTAALASGDTIRCSGTYEAAS